MKNVLPICLDEQFMRKKWFLVYEEKTNIFTSQYQGIAKAEKFLWT